MNFLFGKKPDIFNKKGHPQHNLKESTWKGWKKRYSEGQEYDWSKHSGMRYTEESPTPTSPQK